MKNLIVIIVCLLVSTWAVFTFFDSPEDVAAPPELERAGRDDHHKVKQVRLPARANQSGKSVWLALPSEKEKTRKNTEIVSKVSIPAADQAARAVRVFPRQTKEADKIGPKMGIKSTFDLS